MKQLIKWIVDFIISFLKDMIAKTKIKKLKKEVEDATKTADYDVEKATDYYHDFMSDYAAYKSDLKRRGHAEGLRKGNSSTEESNRQSESSDKETKRVDS
jgi:hypothetical protein